MPRQVYYANPTNIRLTRFADRGEDVERAKLAPYPTVCCHRLELLCVANWPRFGNSLEICICQPGRLTMDVLDNRDVSWRCLIDV